MSYDGITMAAVCHELSTRLSGARVEKIYQPHKLEIIFKLRTAEQSGLILVCSADASLARVHLTQQKPENPPAAPSFCMLLRKHLEGARLLEVTQSSLDRVLTFTFRGYDDFGIEIRKYLICELMGKHSNLILTSGETNRILGSAKTISSSMSRHRTVAPGETYLSPPQQSKLDLQSITEEALAAALDREGESHPEQLLVSAVMGLGIEVSRELLFRASGGDCVHPLEVLRRLTIELRSLKDLLNSGSFEPCIACSPDHKTYIFSPIRLTRIPADWLTFYSSANTALDVYYSRIINFKKETELKQRLLQLVRNHLTRAGKKQQIQQKELREMKGADRFRLYGELLTANQSHVSAGAREAALPNYYSAELDTINIPLDPALSVQANARRYFKKYRKFKDGQVILAKRMKETDNEIAYLESLLASVEHADLDTLNEILSEMEQSGLVRASSAHGKPKHAKPSPPLHFLSADGIDIYVGRNNNQNDRLTLKSAAPDDTWLHVKDIPGAHVIVKSSDPPEQTLKEAAKLAVRYSRAAASSNVPVDYTHAKHVRKPKSAKPGMVIYTNQHTLYVTVDE
jgi:predicted ribosome quality control (RQC) complex YloA/Tae2 family protein